MSGSFQNVKDIPEREVFVKEPAKTADLICEDWEKSDIEKLRKCPLQTWQVIFICILLVVLGIVIAVIFLVFAKNCDSKLVILEDEITEMYSCSKACNITVLESIPVNVTFPSGSVSHPSVFEGWVSLLSKANKSLDIASSYWSLQGKDTNTTDASTAEGDRILSLLKDAAKRGVQIRIVHQVPGTYEDIAELAQCGNVEARGLDMKSLVGAGIIHTKMWLVDGLHYYVGSANMDWRSLTQVKEVGLVTYNCECMAQDMQKIFDVYWMMAKPGAKIPPEWPDYLHTEINKEHPLAITVNGAEAGVYLASSPPQFCPTGRTSDLDSLLNLFSEAREQIDIEIMDYFPSSIYTEKREYWPVLDNALRTAAFDNGVRIRLLAGLWKHTRSDMVNYLRSLQDLDGVVDKRKNLNVSIQVKLFHIPDPFFIPYTRVNHDKFAVTDKAAYVGTSNWSKDYFVSTCGIGYIVNQTDTSSENTVQEQLRKIFERDWNSTYAQELPPRS